MKKWTCVFFLLQIFASSFGQTITIPPKVYCAPKKLNGPVYALNPGRLPQFPGGDSALQNYVQKHLVLDKKLEKKANGKRVAIAFDVDTNGAVCNIKVGQFSGDPQLDPLVRDAAVNLVCGMPAWIPGGEGVYKVTGSTNLIVEMTVDVYFPKTEHGKKTPPYIKLPKWEPTKINHQVENSEDAPLAFAEVLPQCTVNYQKYLADSLRYPVAEKLAGKEGTVFVSFVIEKDGSVTNVEVVKGVADAPGFTTEAVRLISSMPKWTPGKMNGKPVRVIMTQPVKFSLSQ